MDNEDLLPEGSEVDTAAPIAPDTADEQAAHDPAEDLAIELGWSPKENWRGDEADWKPATDFLKTTVEISKAQRKETKALRDQLSRLERTTGTLIERTVADERAKWESKKAEGIDLGDHQAVNHAEQQLRQLEVAPIIAADVDQFKARHSAWFEVDPSATDLAIATAERYKALPIPQQLEKVEEVVRKRFPEYFDAPKPAAKPQASVSNANGRMAATPARKQGYDALPPDAKKAAAVWEKKGVTKEQFAQEYWKDNA